jgi:hypothetical protein
MCHLKIKILICEQDLLLIDRDMVLFNMFWN